MKLGILVRIKDDWFKSQGFPEGSLVVTSAFHHLSYAIVVHLPGAPNPQDLGIRVTSLEEVPWTLEALLKQMAGGLSKELLHLILEREPNLKKEFIGEL